MWHVDTFACHDFDDALVFAEHSLWSQQDRGPVLYSVSIPFSPRFSMKYMIVNSETYAVELQGYATSSLAIDLEHPASSISPRLEVWS